MCFQFASCIISPPPTFVLNAMTFETHGSDYDAIIQGGTDRPTDNDDDDDNRKTYIYQAPKADEAPWEAVAKAVRERNCLNVQSSGGGLLTVLHVVPEGCARPSSSLRVLVDKDACTLYFCGGGDMTRVYSESNVHVFRGESSKVDGLPFFPIGFLCVWNLSAYLSFFLIICLLTTRMYELYPIFHPFLVVK